MVKSNSAFLIELYEEYLEEASFLYVQRLSLLKNPEIKWTKIAEFEERFQAHIEGLLVGEELAIRVCSDRVREGDSGELHAAVRVFCRQNRKDLVLAALDTIDLEDSAKVKAMGDALKCDVPVHWHPDLWQLSKTNLALAPMLMPVLGYRRAEAGQDLAAILQSSNISAAADLLWTAGRVGNSGLQVVLSRFLSDQDLEVRCAAALALLRLGDGRTLQECLRQISSYTWPLIPAGLAGVRSTPRTLLDSVPKSEIDDDWLIALGLLGDVSVVPALLAKLEHPKLAAAAAASLHLITGANFSEKVFVPDEIDEDELFEDEREKLRQGQVPLRGDGKPFGVTVVRLSQKLDDWSGWWAENGPAFDSRMRYRHGTLYSPMSLLKSLECPQTPYRLRQLAYEELVIRYAMDVPFEADMFVSEQMRALAQIDRWIQANEGRFREGAWYFHGNLMYG